MATSKYKFSAAFIRKVVTGEQTGEFSDTDSPLRVKRTSTGAQFLIRKRINGRLISITARDVHGTPIADAARVWTLVEARTWARGTVADLTRGKAPARRAQPTAADTVAAFAKAQLEAYTKTAAPNSVKTRTAGIADVVAVIGALPISDVGASAARQVRDALSGRSLSIQNRAWSAGSWLMGLAIEAGLAESNPFARGAVKAPKRAAARDRHLTIEQMVEVWHAAGGDTGGDLVRLLMTVPLRATAAATMVWSEVDLDGRVITLQPGPGRKFKTVQRLPIPDLAVEILKARKPARPEGLVFRNSAGKPFESWYSLLKRLPFAGEWSPHDLRRSVVTALADAAPDLPLADIDLWLQHSRGTALGTVGAIYQRSERQAGMRLVADTWGRILSAALAADYVREAA